MPRRIEIEGGLDAVGSAIDLGVGQIAAVCL